MLMKSHTRLYFTLLGLFLLSAGSLVAQKGIEVGIHGGFAHYYGDLNPTYKISDPGLALGFKFRRNFNERICVAAGLDYGRVSGSDSDSYNSFERTRNLDFRSNVVDLNFTWEFNFFPYVHGTSDQHYTPYFFAGFSMMRFNPKTDLDGVTYSLADYNTETKSDNTNISYSLASGSLVYGVGFKWDINRDFSFNVHLSGRSLFSDYIDDVSQNYPSNNPGSIDQALADRSGDVNFAAPKSQRGDGLSNDSVYFLSVGIVRYYGKLHCPPILKDLF